MRMNRSKYGRPAPGERCAFPQRQVAKRAALLFDRICVPSWRDREESIPSCLQFDLPDYEQKHEVWDRVKYQLFEEYKKSKCRENEVLYTIDGILMDDLDKFLDEFEVRLWVEHFRLSGRPVTPVYNSQQRFASDYPPGNGIAYQAALENIPEIVEDHVSWEQILQFRSDEKAIRKYRELRFWLEYSLTAQSLEHAKDLIAHKIEDYEWAIHKHGLETVTGALSSIFGWKGLASVGAGLGIGAAIGEPVWSALTGALVIIGRVSVWVAERAIEREAIERGPDSGVALICDAKHLGRRRKI